MSAANPHGGTSVPAGTCVTHGYHGCVTCPTCSSSAIPPARIADAARGHEVILIGTPRTETSDAADRLLDGITVALQEFDTETLNAIAEYRHSLDPDGWMSKLIWQYVEVWR